VVALAATFDDPSENARAFDEQHAFTRCQRIAMDQGNFGETFEGLHEAAMAELNQLRGLAKYLVIANADIIKRVAHALSRKITLDEAAINALVPDAELKAPTAAGEPAQADHRAPMDRRVLLHHRAYARTAALTSRAVTSGLRSAATSVAARSLSPHHSLPRSIGRSGGLSCGGRSTRR
jgi:hypothetical protein